MTEPRTVRIGALAVSNAAPLTLIAGPCQLEGRDHALMIAETAGRGLRRRRRRLHLQELLRQGEPNLGLGDSAASDGRGPGDPRRGPRADRLPGADRRPPARRLRPGRRGRRRPADSGLPVAPDRPPARRRPHRRGDQRQEGPVPRALGHAERRRQDRLDRQRRASCSASAAPRSATTPWSSTCAACRSWPAPATRW